MKNLKKHIEAHLTEEGKGLLEHLNFDDLEKDINDEVNNIVAKNKPDTDKVRQEVLQEVLKEAGVEGESVDDLKKHIDGLSTDEFKGKYEEAQTRLETLEKEKAEVEGKYNTKEQQDAIKKMGVKDDDQVEFVHYKVQQMVSDEKPFEEALKEYKEEKPDYFKNKSSSTHSRFGDPSDFDGDAPERDYILQRRGKK